jgi:hypothetical protein
MFGMGEDTRATLHAAGMTLSHASEMGDSLGTLHASGMSLLQAFGLAQSPREGEVSRRRGSNGNIVTLEDSRNVPRRGNIRQTPVAVLAVGDDENGHRLSNNGNVVAQDGETANINDHLPPYDNPPPYDDEEASRRLFGRIQATLNTERGGEDTDPAETESLRGFLLYCLSVDYRFKELRALSASTRNKYIEMWSLMRTLRKSHDNTDLTERERTVPAPYLWKYLHRPCKRLSIPIELAVRVIDRFVKHTDSFNRYKGCVHGVLQSGGLETLAGKFWYDRSILIPRLVDNEHTRRGLTECLTDVARQYFVSIDGVHSTIGAVPGETWDEEVGVSYKLTARVESYDLARERTLMTSVLDYARDFRDAISWCLSDVSHRRDIFPEGKIDSDRWASWNGPSEDHEWSAGMQSTSQRWVWYPSLHIPDLFEHRPGANRCEQ